MCGPCGWYIASRWTAWKSSSVLIARTTVGGTHRSTRTPIDLRGLSQPSKVIDDQVDFCRFKAELKGHHRRLLAAGEQPTNGEQRHPVAPKAHSASVDQWVDLHAGQPRDVVASG